MNDARSKEIRRALTLIGEAKGILELALSQEQDDLDNMPRSGTTCSTSLREGR